MRKSIEIRIGKKIEEDLRGVIKNPEKLNILPKRIVYLENVEILSAILSPNRIKILQTLKAQPEIGINKLANMLNRPREAVSRDIHLLNEHRLIQIQKQGVHVKLTVSIDQLVIPITA